VLFGVHQVLKSTMGRLSPHFINLLGSSRRKQNATIFR
jgi:hypothetical protein